MARSNLKVAVVHPADAEIERLEALVKARRAVKHAELALEDEQARHRRIMAKLTAQHSEAQKSLAAALCEPDEGVQLAAPQLCAHGRERE